MRVRGAQGGASKRRGETATYCVWEKASKETAAKGRRALDEGKLKQVLQSRLSLYPCPRQLFIVSPLRVVTDAVEGR